MIPLPWGCGFVPWPWRGLAFGWPAADARALSGIRAR